MIWRGPLISGAIRQFWGDVLWSWARNWSEVRWLAFRHHLTKEQVKARFDEKATKTLQFKREAPTPDQQHEGYDRDSTDSVDRAEIWEIWDKESGKARVDEAVCVGCGVCTDICPEIAIVREETN